MTLLHLEANDSGGWRRVMSFEQLDIVVENVMLDAGQLLSAADNRRIRARIIAPGATAPLMTWTAADGWKDWRQRGGEA